MTMDFADEPSLVHIENQTLGLFLEEKEDLAAFRLHFGNILDKALPQRSRWSSSPPSPSRSDEGAAWTSGLA